MNTQKKLQLLDDLLLIATRPECYDSGEIALIADLRSHYLRAEQREITKLTKVDELREKNAITWWESPSPTEKVEAWKKWGEATKDEGRKLKSKDVDCPTCKVSAGQDCKQMTSRGPHGKPTRKLLVTTKGQKYQHQTRRNLAHGRKK